MLEYIITDCANCVATAGRVATTNSVGTDRRGFAVDRYCRIMCTRDDAAVAAVVCRRANQPTI